MGNLVKLPFSDIGSTLELLAHEGVREEHWNRLRSDESYRRRVAGLMLRGGLEGSVHQKLARAVMGQNFFGLEEWATLYNARFTRKQEREVAEFPWGEDILNSPCPFVKGKTIRETHFAFLGLKAINGESLTILTLQKLHPATGQPKFYSYAPSAWYSSHDFAKVTTLSFRWYLMLKDIVPKSTSTNFENQKAMLPAEYEVPLCVEEVSKDLLAFRKNGAYPNGSVYARCSVVSADGFRLIAGYCGHGGVSVHYWDDDGDYDVGLAASRKLPS